MTGTTGPGICPQCASPIPVPPPPLCPRCQYPLLLVQGPGRLESEANRLERPTPEPRAEAATTISAAPAPAPPPPPLGPPGQFYGPPLFCPRCGLGNDPSRVWCERCGNPLVTAPVAEPPPPPPPQPRRSVWSRLWFPIALALAIGIGFGGSYLVSQWGTVVTPQPSASATTTTSPPKPTPSPTPISNKTIKVKASSTLPDVSGQSYAPSLTIDGNPKTAWNSDGDQVGANAKVSLEWTFPGRVMLTSIDIHNGYQKDRDRYYANGRIKSVRIVTDAGERVVELADKMGPQSVVYDFGVTTFVRFRVESVYRSGARYQDLALSEVKFFGVKP